MCAPTGPNHSSSAPAPASISGTSTAGVSTMICPTVDSSASERWHREDDHRPHRRSMIRHIFGLLHSSPQLPENDVSVDRIRNIALQLEVCLYRDAPSFEAYINRRTVPQRLRDIANQVSSRRDSAASSTSSTAAATTDAVPTRIITFSFRAYARRQERLAYQRECRQDERVPERRQE